MTLIEIRVATIKVNVLGARAAERRTVLGSGNMDHSQQPSDIIERKASAISNACFDAVEVHRDVERRSASSD
jgi:hypothetical protein